MNFFSPPIPLRVVVANHVAIARLCSKQVPLLRRLGLYMNAQEMTGKRRFHMREARVAHGWLHGSAANDEQTSLASLPSIQRLVALGAAMTFPPTTLRFDNPQGVADALNGLLGFPQPEPGNRGNGWFGGYGCRWCAASRAWFVVLPANHGEIGEWVARLFRDAGCPEVTLGYEGGVSPEDGGRGFQISARL